MEGIMNKNQFIVDKKYEFDKPDFYGIDYLLDDTIKDCRNKYIRKFEHRLVCDIQMKYF